MALTSSVKSRDAMEIRRVILIILDSAGVGELPDAREYGDEGSNTIGNVARALGGLTLRNMGRLGLGNLTFIPGTPAQTPLGACGKMALKSKGKDTTTGHWELAGIILDKPFRTYPGGFPRDVIDAFERRIGRKVLGNKPASGTEIINELGEIHMREGRPIVYTSQDSVFQIACHEDIVPVDTLYDWCRVAREILTGDNLVARVIARPFTGTPGHFVRTPRRKDFSVAPPEPTLLDYAQRSGIKVLAIGKIQDIFAGRGIDLSYHTDNNAHGIETIKKVMKETSCRGAPDICRERFLIFANLVDFDMVYGHRNDVKGYGRALLEFDQSLDEIMPLVEEDDVLVITADHGCDPVTPSTDHSREYVPLLIWGKKVRPHVNLGVRESLSDLGATIGDMLEVSYGGKGRTFIEEIMGKKG